MLNRFVEYCKNTLDFEQILIMPEYKSLPLCIIDCIYSLRTKYEPTTVRIVQRYADAYLKGDITGEDTLKDFMQYIDEVGYQGFAENILNNKQLLANKLKSEICYEIARKLLLLGINTLEDFRNYKEFELIEIVLSSIKGVGAAAINYLFMLAGDQNRCKLDVHLEHFIKDATGATLNNEEVQRLFKEAVSLLKIDYPGMTVMRLDGIIWRKYSSRK